MDPLELHGPRQRIQEAVDAARAGRCLVTSPGGRGPAIADKLDVALAHHGYQLLQIGPQHTAEHCAELLSVNSISDPGRLLQNSNLNRQVLQIDCTSPFWRDWAILVLQRLVGGAPAQCLRFWLIWPDAVKRPGAKVLHPVDWTGCITPTDVRIYAADRFRNRTGPGPTNYWECLAADLAGPDLELIDRMAGLTAPLLDPIAWLQACGQSAHSTVAYGAVPRFESPITLAARSSSDPAAVDELNRRIWNAQVRSLFCGMEAERIPLLAPLKRQLDASYALIADPEVLAIPRDVEWSSAYGRLRGDRTVSDSTKTLLLHARDVRNSVAHGEAISPSLLALFLAAAAVTIKGRWL